LDGITNFAPCEPSIRQNPGATPIRRSHRYSDKDSTLYLFGKDATNRHAPELDASAAKEFP